jgi:putative heme iron utilization protein
MNEVAKDVIRPTDAEAIRLARTLIRSARHGALAVLDPTDGGPLASRVAVATDIDGTPLILISGLSAHTGALLADPRCSLLVGKFGKGDPLAYPRITLSCVASRIERGTEEHGRVERRYLNHNPKARLYAGLGDFAYFSLAPKKASLNGGFGKAYLFDRGELLTESPANEVLTDHEQAAIDHMNADHRDAIAVYARHFAQAGDGDWAITGIDADGLDIASGDAMKRVFFPEPLKEVGQLRPVLVSMAKAGRAAESNNE